ncbi:hypothetical protein [Anatilimnocola floriformis]|uniref:hypothetical protein n=1 Tax=Anatilimnocola floriformis TaxID=2948575 RepID=UPI0020C35CB6|nr:hypothetical protein [Anatilimnocola floriformis]
MSSQTARFLYVLGIILMLLGIADVALNKIWGIDLTGTRWSAMILGGTGIVLMNVARYMPQSPPPRRVRWDEEETDLDDDKE